jgi:Arc/MetJ family transcription regulator
MTYEETMTWGYRLNQLLRWQASQEEMEAQARAWGFTASDAQAMAEVATALQADENIFR